jgi:hypothetical protein
MSQVKEIVTPITSAAQGDGKWPAAAGEISRMTISAGREREKKRRGF